MTHLQVRSAAVGVFMHLWSELQVFKQRKLSGWVYPLGVTERKAAHRQGKTDALLSLLCCVMPRERQVRVWTRRQFCSFKEKEHDSREIALLLQRLTEVHTSGLKMGCGVGGKRTSEVVPNLFFIFLSEELRCRFLNTTHHTFVPLTGFTHSFSSAISFFFGFVPACSCTVVVKTRI